MASEKHQIIAGIVARKMKEMGYSIVAFDGKSFWIGEKEIHIPLALVKHRPDLIGINANNEICIGEAKTTIDITTKRTRRQLIDFSNIKSKSDREVMFFVGTPLSGKQLILNIIQEVGLKNKNNLVIITVPDILLEKK